VRKREIDLTIFLSDFLLSDHSRDDLIFLIIIIIFILCH
jgi:hypothetical protein